MIYPPIKPMLFFPESGFDEEALGCVQRELFLQAFEQI